MERIVVRHISGSKANQVEEFPLNHIKELTFGRDPSATVKYDPDRDDLVGRVHARISQDPDDPTRFTLTDLNSRNGTFLNKQRITGTTAVAPGDVVQFGPGGPEFQFDLEPRPQSALRPTRGIASDSYAPTVTGAPPTRAVDLGAAAHSSAAGGNGGARPAGTVGKATVERMISQNIAVTKRTEQRRFALIGGGALVLVLLLFAGVAGYLYLRNRDAATQIAGITANRPLSPTEIAESQGDSVVMIEVSWKLIAPDGGLVYQKHNCLYEGPCFIEVADDVIEPVLTDEQHRNGGQPINGAFTATGFVVSNDGFILTNRHVSYAWKSVYPLNEWRTGTLFRRDGTVERFDPSAKDIKWVPELTALDKQIELISRMPKVLDKDKKKKNEITDRGTLTSITGVNDRLEVAFPGSNSRIAAQLVRASEDQDVAMIKISVPDTTRKVELYDNYDAIKQGDVAVLMGYPETSPPIYGFSKQTDTSRSKLREIPDPTVSVGNIGRLIRPRKEVAGKRETLNVYGDAFQLSVNSTGSSNSGGPVFDDRGRVVGIFVAKGADSSMSFAIPIRYGQELMSVGNR